MQQRDKFQVVSGEVLQALGNVAIRIDSPNDITISSRCDPRASGE